MQKMTFYNKDRRNTSNLLANALANRKQDNIQMVGINPFANKSQNSVSLEGGLGSALNTAGNLYNTFKNTSSNNTDSGNHLASSFVDMGLGNAENLTFNNLLGGSGNIAPYGGLISGGIRAGIEGLNDGDWKDEVPQSFFGIDSKANDVSQTINGVAQGAIMGAPFGPPGMIIGGLLGGGASFLDDLHF